MPNRKINLIPSKDAAEQLGVDRATLNRWAKAGKLTPAIEGEGLRGARFYRQSDIDKVKATTKRGTAA